MNDENDIVQSDDEDDGKRCSAECIDAIYQAIKEIKKININIQQVVKELHQMNKNRR